MTWRFHLRRIDMSDNRWIKVEDRLPEPGVNVLALHRGYDKSTIKIEWLTFSGGAWIFDKAYGRVTHWMPLPEPPKEDDHA